jgi:hypothetical protein
VTREPAWSLSIDAHLGVRKVEIAVIILKIHVLDASDKISSPPICAVLLEPPDASHVSGKSLCVARLGSTASTKMAVRCAACCVTRLYVVIRKSRSM